MAKLQFKKCTSCGEELAITSENFYKSYSILYKKTYENRIGICRKCLFEVFNEYKKKFKSELRAIYEICRLLDFYYSKDIYDMAVKQVKKRKTEPDKNSVCRIYFQKAVSLPQYKGKTFIDSEQYEIMEDYTINSDYEVTDDSVRLWGEGKSPADYKYLQDEYETLLTKYEHDSYSQEILFQEIAFQRLEIRKKRAKGDSVDKEQKTLQDLLGSANIKPVQENALMSNEQVTIGTLIKKFENEEPIPEPRPEWMSADWIKKYVTTWFFGGLARMMGKANPFAKEFEEELEKYTVNPNDGEEDE